MTVKYRRLALAVMAGIAVFKAAAGLNAPDANEFIVFSALPQDALARERVLEANVRFLDSIGWIRARGCAVHYRALADMRHRRSNYRSESELRMTALQVGPSTLDDRLATVKAFNDIGDDASRQMAAALLQDAMLFSERPDIGPISQLADDLKLPMSYGRDLLPALKGDVALIALGAIDADIVDRAARSIGLVFGPHVRVLAKPDFEYGPPDRFHAAHEQYDIAGLSDAVSAALHDTIDDKSLTAVMVLTDKDMYMPGLNFLWATGSEGYSLISTARLADPDPAVTADRIAKQAITSTLDRLYIPRASHPKCANANAISVDEMDQKTLTLCAEARVHLDARLAALQAAATAP